MTPELLDKLGKAYFRFAVANQNLFTRKEDFQLIQYINEDHHNRLFVLADKVSKQLEVGPRYLNIGMGGGYLEYCAKSIEGLTVDGVEWNRQDRHFSPIRNVLDVDRKYVCNDITLAAFEIAGADTENKYDYAILCRFYPLNLMWTKDQEKIKNYIRRLQKYVNRVIVVEIEGNFSEFTVDFFTSNSEKIVELGNEHNYKMYYLNEIV